MKRNVLNSPRLLELKKKRLKIFLNKIFLSLVALLVIFASLAYISRLKQLNINEVEIIGNKTEDKEIIETTVKKEITGNYSWFFPKTNIFFYPKDNIKKDLFNQFNRLKSISLSVKNKMLKVALTERTALYTWCGIEFPEALLVESSTSKASGKEEKCYFMDEAGYIFDEAPYFSGDVYFKFYGLANFGTYFSKENFRQLIYFKDTLLGIGLKPVSLYILDNGDIKVFLSNSNKAPTEPYIALKAGSNFQKVAENLEIALSAEPLQSNFKNKYSSLLYIDLRFGNKVYYKFKVS